MSDGTYDFQDLVDINRALDVRDENQRRANLAAAEMMRKG
jgi:hypothetical protein